MTTFQQGILLALIYNVLTAAKGVFLGSLLQGADTILVVFCTFLIVAIFFNGLQKFRPKEKKEANRKSAGLDLLMVNVLTASAWMTFYLAVKNLEPAVATALANCLGPVITLIMAYRLQTGAKPMLLEIVASLGVVASMTVLVGITWFGKTGISTFSNDRIFWGLTMALVCGVSMAFNNLFSKRLNQKGWDAKEILASRFYILLGMSLLLLNWETISWLQAPMHLLELLGISVMGVIIPLFAFQKSLQKLEPIFVSLVLATAPLMTFMIQMFDRRIEFSIWSLSGIALVIGFSLLGVYARFRSQKHVARIATEEIGGLPPRMLKIRS